MSTIKVDTVRPVTADASLTLQGDSGGSGVTGLTIDSSGVFNTTTAKVTNIQATSGQSLTIKDEDGNAAITIGTDNTAAGYLSLNFGSYHGDSGGAGSGTLSGNTLDDYEIGSWSPTDNSGAGLTITVTASSYTKIGSLCYISTYVTYPSTASGSAHLIGGLPFTAKSSSTFGELTVRVTSDTVSQQNLTFQITSGTTEGKIFKGANSLVNSDLSSLSLLISGVYQVA